MVQPITDEIFTPEKKQAMKKIICSWTDKKQFVACGFCGVKISSVIGYLTIIIIIP